MCQGSVGNCLGACADLERALKGLTTDTWGRGCPCRVGMEGHVCNKLAELMWTGFEVRRQEMRSYTHIECDRLLPQWCSDEEWAKVRNAVQQEDSECSTSGTVVPVGTSALAAALSAALIAPLHFTSPLQRHANDDQTARTSPAPIVAFITNRALPKRFCTAVVQEAPVNPAVASSLAVMLRATVAAADGPALAEALDSIEFRSIVALVIALALTDANELAQTFNVLVEERSPSSIEAARTCCNASIFALSLALAVADDKRLDFTSSPTFDTESLAASETDCDLVLAICRAVDRNPQASALLDLLSELREPVAKCETLQHPSEGGTPTSILRYALQQTALEERIQHLTPQTPFEGCFNLDATARLIDAADPTALARALCNHSNDDTPSVGSKGSSDGGGEEDEEGDEGSDSEEEGAREEASFVLAKTRQVLAQAHSDGACATQSRSDLASLLANDTFRTEAHNALVTSLTRALLLAIASCSNQTARSTVARLDREHATAMEAVERHLNCVDTEGRTMLHHAVHRSDVPAVRWLLRHGAHAVTSGGRVEQPIAVAIDRLAQTELDQPIDPTVLYLLLRHGADPKKPCTPAARGSLTPMCYAKQLRWWSRAWQIERLLDPAGDAEAPGAAGSSSDALAPAASPTGVPVPAPAPPPQQELMYRVAQAAADFAAVCAGAANSMNQPGQSAFAPAVPTCGADGMPVLDNSALQPATSSSNASASTAAAQPPAAAAPAPAHGGAHPDNEAAGSSSGAPAPAHEIRKDKTRSGYLQRLQANRCSNNQMDSELGRSGAVLEAPSANMHTDGSASQLAAAASSSASAPPAVAQSPATAQLSTAGSPGSAPVPPRNAAAKRKAPAHSEHGETALVARACASSSSDHAPSQPVEQPQPHGELEVKHLADGKSTVLYVEYLDDKLPSFSTKAKIQECLGILERTTKQTVRVRDKDNRGVNVETTHAEAWQAGGALLLGEVSLPIKLIDERPQKPQKRRKTVRDGNAVNQINIAELADSLGIRPGAWGSTLPPLPDQTAATHGDSDDSASSYHRDVNRLQDELNTHGPQS